MTELFNTRVRTAVFGLAVVLFFLGTGTAVAQDTTEISTVEELQNMEEDLDADYVLVEDIDASATQDWNDGAGFDPVGDFESGENLEFNGTFDGNGHTISNLYIDRPDEDFVGLFGVVAGPDQATVENVVLEDIDVTGDGNVGSIAGVNNIRGDIQNVDVTSVVNGGTNVAGAVGENRGELTETNFEGDVVGGSSVGGLVGSNFDSGEVSDSSSVANVEGSEGVGGVIGGNSGEVVDVYSGSNVTGSSILGGLVGSNGGTVKKAHANGTVEAEDLVGGLIGTNEGTVEKSYANSSVYGSGTGSGGLVGLVDDGTVNNSYATGYVEGSEGVGALVGGISSAQVTTSYAAGTVVGDEDVGGLVGQASQASVDASFWDEDATGQDTSAGGERLTTSEMWGSTAVDTMSGFDFENVWIAKPDSYPELNWQTSTLQQSNPFADTEGQPVSSIEAIQILDDWRDGNEVDGVEISPLEMIEYLDEWRGTEN